MERSSGEKMHLEHVSREVSKVGLEGNEEVRRLTCHAKGRDLRLKRAKIIARTFQLVRALIWCRSTRR